MAKKIKMNLSESSIQAAIDELEKYKQNLTLKCQILVDRLAKEGLQVVQATMESVPDIDRGSYFTEVINNSDGTIKRATIRLTGDKVLFIEFAAGIRYESPANPKASELGYGPGTYPGKGHWNDPNGWWYRDESGNPHHSYGNRAYMPMYHASTALTLMLKSLAREVFEQ